MQHIRRLMLIMAVLSILAGSLAFSSGNAHAQTRTAHVASWTVCRTLDLSAYWWEQDIRPHMAVPVCYNGSRIWQAGSVTAGVDALLYIVDGVTWAGTYNSGGSWIGAGENYSVTFLLNWATFFCPSRWNIDAWGNVVYFARGC